MQGRKEIQPKMHYEVHIDRLVPEDNFYRKLADAIDLSFLYKAKAKYYGKEGQASIDPVVFFKICWAIRCMKSLRRRKRMLIG